jgi:hypothetical protein
MQLSKKSSYLSEKMHIEKVTGKNVMKCYGTGSGSGSRGKKNEEKMHFLVTL